MFLHVPHECTDNYSTETKCHNNKIHLKYVGHGKPIDDFSVFLTLFPFCSTGFKLLSTKEHVLLIRYITYNCRCY